MAGKKTTSGLRQAMPCLRPLLQPGAYHRLGGRVAASGCPLHQSVMDEIMNMGLDIDQGMVLKIDDQIYCGTDAIHAITLLETRSGLFTGVNFWVFRSERASRQLLISRRVASPTPNKGIALQTSSRRYSPENCHCAYEK